MADQGENGEPRDVEEPLTDEEDRLEPEIAARRQAALARLRTFGDPALRTKAAEVTSFDDALAEEVARMGQLMSDALGVGLAATQLGVMHRLLVYRAGPDAPLVAVVNPRLDWASSEQEEMEEGCLSLPGVAVDVERPIHVRVKASDARGEGILLEASGLEARVIQHEMDHLDGILILDRTTREQRKEALRILREGPNAGGDADSSEDGDSAGSSEQQAEASRA
jgi:peptide deformylase